jgi:hypothetical protein
MPLKVSVGSYSHIGFKISKKDGVLTAVSVRNCDWFLGLCNIVSTFEEEAKFSTTLYIKSEQLAFFGSVLHCYVYLAAEFCHVFKNPNKVTAYQRLGLLPPSGEMVGRLFTTSRLLDV